MDNQTIKITLEEYKELRDKIEEYSILIKQMQPKEQHQLKGRWDLIKWK